MGRTVLRLVLLGAAFALATLLFGWWGVPAVGTAWGAISWRARSAGVVAAIAALGGWGAILAWSASRGPAGALADTLGAIMGAPGAAIVALTLVFAAALAWAAARTAAGVAAILTSRGS